MATTDAESALIEYAIRDALAEVVGVDAHDMVIAYSLSRMGLPSLPTERDALESFCDGPLSDSLHEMLGHEAAIAVQAQLETVLPRIFRNSQTVAAVPPKEVDTVRAPDPLQAEGADTARLQAPSSSTVFLVSEDESLPATIKLSINSPTPVVRVSSMLSLYEAMPESWGPPLVVVDARGKLDIVPLLDLSEQLPSRARVIVWGNEEQLRQDAPQLLRRDEWLSFETTAEAEDVGAMLSLLVG